MAFAIFSSDLPFRFHISVTYFPGANLCKCVSFRPVGWVGRKHWGRVWLRLRIVHSIWSHVICPAGCPWNGKECSVFGSVKASRNWLRKSCKDLGNYFENPLIASSWTEKVGLKNKVSPCVSKLSSWYLARLKSVY